MMRPDDRHVDRAKVHIGGKVFEAKNVVLRFFHGVHSMGSVGPPIMSPREIRLPLPDRGRRGEP